MNDVVTIKDNQVVEDKETDASTVRHMILQTSEKGSAGTEIFGGYLYEEFLEALRGSKRADEYDKMRRSDPQIKMVLSAVKNPIRSGDWQINPVDQSPQAKYMAEFVENVLFKNSTKTWRNLLNEILTCIDFGAATFEVTHAIVKDSKKFGTYVTLSKLGLRSAKTIERWNVGSDGELKSISQNSYGDTGKNVEIPAEYLYNFVIDKEGDNYEGVSMLRPCYGPHIRKRKLQQLSIVGNEKHAVPAPIGEVPEGKYGGKEYEIFKEVLEHYTSHQKQWITTPAGWKITFADSKFDPQKLNTCIDSENKEIVKAFLANFLELGLGSTSGSYSLSFDLSDFFLGGIEHIADMICEVFNTKIIPDLIQLNFGPQECYPTMTCSGISDRAGVELANALKTLVDGRMIVPDLELEKRLRSMYGLPEISMLDQRKAPAANPFFSEKKGELTPPEKTVTLTEKSGAVLFAEKPKSPQALMVMAQEKLRETMQKGLKEVGNGYVKQLMRGFNTKSDLKVASTVTDLNEIGFNKYKEAIKMQLAEIAELALQQVRKEVPKAKDVKLTENLDSIKFADAFSKLPKIVQEYIAARAVLLTETQLEELKKQAGFQFLGSAPSTDSAKLVQADIDAAIDKYIEGSNVAVSAANAASYAVNEARHAFLFDPEVLEEVESFTFENEDPVSAICQDLVGQTFLASDPEAQRYMPPLHHNCKSYLSANLKGTRGANREVTGLQPSNAKLESEITFAEHERCGCLKKV